ncbi:MAG: ABC transporter ATP-binding protein [Candidatus Paceibacterota bacterium]|jgi:NitT/TauT family transport system ATP-binding protein
MNTILELKGVSKTFEEDSFEVLKDLDFKVKDGEFVSIVGPSGAGKSILLFLIAGFLKQSKGTVLMNNKEIKGIDTSRIIMFQNYILFPWKTVYQNVLFALTKSKISKKEKEELVMKYLDLVGLTQFKDWYVHKLSGGMQQRVAIARSLILNPKILLMDEPFSALDTHQRAHLREVLIDVWEKTKQTIIFVTHHVDEAIQLADTIYLVTSRPATIKKIYNVDWPRPRSNGEKPPLFLKLKKEIKDSLMEEFEKSCKNNVVEPSLENFITNVL